MKPVFWAEITLVITTYVTVLLRYGKYVGFITQDLRAGVAIIFACLVLIVFACLLDMWTGIDAARINKEKFVAGHYVRQVRKSSTITDWLCSSS